MSMSTHIVGIAPPHEQWQRMKAIYDSCDAAGVDVPKEVLAFFGYDEPDDAGVFIDLQLTPWSDDGRQGFELNVKDIPAHVSIIRFYNAW